MMEILSLIMAESWGILEDSAVFMIFGLFVAGVIKAFLPDRIIAKHLGKGNRFGVLKASLLGAPVPLCSCGVVPAAAGLREQGAGKGETAAFLIATPETGIDSIAVTYALLDPLMTVLRPFSAILTALATGAAVKSMAGHEPAAPVKPLSLDSQCSGADCSCGSTPPKRSFLKKIGDGLSFAFDDLLKDIGMWFILGVLIAGTITALLPENFFGAYVGEGFGSMLVMLLIAVPIYVCATSSTPVAAALVLKGLSPGAAMVFLLAGPATNAASLTVISKLIGKKATGIYLASIIACSLAIGVLTNMIYDVMNVDALKWTSGSGEAGIGWVSVIFAFLLLLLIFRSRIKHLVLVLTSAATDG